MIMTEKKITLKIVVDDENIANLYPNYSLNWDSAEEFIAHRIAEMCTSRLWDGKPIDYLKEYGFEITCTNTQKLGNRIDDEMRADLEAQDYGTFGEDKV